LASCELRVASCELRVASCELRVASGESIVLPPTSAPAPLFSSPKSPNRLISPTRPTENPTNRPTASVAGVLVWASPEAPAAERWASLVVAVDYLGPSFEAVVRAAP